MSSSLLPRAISFVAVYLMIAYGLTCLAITGGVSVRDELNDQDGFGEQEVAIAHAISAVTVPLFILNAADQAIGLCTATIVHPRVVLTAAHCIVAGREGSGRLMVYFERGASRRMALDAIVHPIFEKAVRSRMKDATTKNHRRLPKTIDSSVMSNDLALVLLHRPIPETYSAVAPVAPGFHDDRTVQKLIAGYGLINKRASPNAVVLNFAELRGNTRLDEGVLGGQREIVMLSNYRGGARINVCSGDSGGPLLVRLRGASNWQQLAVTSGADDQCSDFAIFANLDSQRPALHEMFDNLMQGEQGTALNPF